MPEVTRGEFGMLRTQVREGIGRLERELATFRRDHEQQHAAELKSRTMGRRWLIATIIAALVALEAPIFYIVGHVH
jgi:hypothetical protein